MKDTITLACPRCHAALEQVAFDAMRCSLDGLTFHQVDGIWRFLLPERTAAYEQFIREYETVRRAEGRGADDAAYYRALPYQDLSTRMPTDWAIRTKSFDTFLAQVLAPLERHNRSLRILDLGAGNGWLSNHLAQRGHALAAVDLTTNDFDGLGCYRYYDSVFTLLQAEFDRLPFPDGATDLVIFNASLHYSVNIQGTLKEALRVLGDTGIVVILDSPVYENGKSGAQMVKERQAMFLRQFGFRSDALPSENYLTYKYLEELAAMLKLHWQYITPFYGLRWTLKPLKAKLLGQREPAKFHVIVGKRMSQV